MNHYAITKNSFLLSVIGLALLLLFFTGCAGMDFGGQSQEASESSGTISENEPYYLTDFSDLLIPGELSWDPKESLTINTDTYNGGILNFKGRVEVNSLTNFFITTMKRNNWSMAGSVKSNDVMIAFTKERSSCLVQIIAGEYGGKTNVFVYITKTSM